MPSTTNFGWTTPADTDYVKDGALAIRTLGNGIDTSLVDLKGGTTGQVLSKASNTDLDYTWTTPNVGDITEVQGGTGITVTSGTGPIPSVAIDSTVATLTGSQTLTNKTIALGSNTVSGTTAQFNTALTDGDFATLAGTETLTNKTISASSNTLTGVINNTLTTTTGDIIYASSANTPARLGIGTTGQVLTVSGGVPSWANAASGSTFVGCSVYRSSDQTLSGGTSTNILWDAEFFDTDAFHSTSTNTARFTIPSGKSGKYLFTANIFLTSSGQQELYIRKNGSAFRRFDFNTSSTRSNVICDVYDLTAGDYLILESYSGGSLNLASGTERSTASIFYLGA